MTKRDYELIAEVFRYHRKRYGGRTDAVVMELISDMADELALDNPRFDRQKFRKACEWEETE